METSEILQCICLEIIESGDNGYVVSYFLLYVVMGRIVAKYLVFTPLAGNCCSRRYCVGNVVTKNSI